MGYTNIEAGLRTVIVDNVTDFNTDNCTSGDPDAAFSHMLKNNETRCCVLEYAGCREKPGGEFSAINLDWMIDVMFFVEYHENVSTVEGEIRAIADEFIAALAGNSILGGEALDSRVISGGSPIVLQRQDKTYVFITFRVSCWDNIT